MTAITRRELLQYGAAGGAMLVLPWRIGDRAAAATLVFAQPTLEPSAIPKFVSPLVVPPAMPSTGTARGVHYYEIAVRQFQQQILPAGLPETTVWSYGSVNHTGTFNYPAFTIEATNGTPVRVKWINDLVDSDRHYLPHLLPVDPTLHWANPPGGPRGRDLRPAFSSTPGSYTGPVPIVTHLHGGENTLQDSDGYPEAWYLPAARNIQGNTARFGTYYLPFRAEAQARMGQAWTPGSAVFQYANEQRAATLWYHDHTLGMTRVNVYAGPAGFYLVRGGPDDLALDTRFGTPAVLPGPAPGVGDNPFGAFFEIPLAIQDRSFNADGSLFYPDSREFFDGFGGPYIGDDGSDISPIWNPEFFGNAIVVNGRTWPYLTVEQRRYRFRLLNGCNSRFLILDFNDVPGVQVWQIGSEGGFLPEPIDLTELGNRILMAPAERADVIVDFANVPVGSHVLRNVGPDDPFGGGVPGEDFVIADQDSTGQVMAFRVVTATAADTTTPPQVLALPAITALPEPSTTREVSLNEADSEVLPDVGPEAARLGTLAPDGTGNALDWDDDITENPEVGATEVWEMYNLTEDAHPIHVHEVQFQVVDREPIEGGGPRSPEPWETGFKDTVIAYPDEITRIKARFGVAGLFVWHCHIVEHEDNEMMRPYRIGPMP